MIQGIQYIPMKQGTVNNLLSQDIELILALQQSKAKDPKYGTNYQKKSKSSILELLMKIS